MHSVNRDIVRAVQLICWDIFYLVTEQHTGGTATCQDKLIQYFLLLNVFVKFTKKGLIFIFTFYKFVRLPYLNNSLRSNFKEDNEKAFKI